MRSGSFLLAMAVTVTTATNGCAEVRRQGALDHYVRGQMLAEQGKLDEALAELAEAANVDPKLAVAHTATGDIHRRRGDHQRARDSYETACQVDPYAFRPHYNLGVTYQVLATRAQRRAQSRTHLRSAARVFLRAHSIRPDDFDTSLNLSACYFQMGRYELGQEYCQAAIRVNRRQAAEAEKIADPAERKAVLGPIHRVGAKAYSNLGLLHQYQDRLAEAIQAYNAALELDSHNPRIITNLGSVYLRQGRLKAALHLFRIAAKDAPDSPTVRELIGVCRFLMDDYAESAEAFGAAVGLNPRSAFAFRGLGLALMSRFVLERRAEFRDQALAAWRKSLAVQPEQEDLVGLLAKYTPPGDPD